MKIGRYNSALTDLWQAVNLDRTAMHYKLLARCNQELKNITDALQNYEEALAHSKSEKNSSEKALIYLERGQLFSKQGDYEAAIADFEKAINMKGDKVPLADVGPIGGFDSLIF